MGNWTQPKNSTPEKTRGGGATVYIRIYYRNGTDPIDPITLKSYLVLFVTWLECLSDIDFINLYTRAIDRFLDLVSCNIKRYIQNGKLHSKSTILRLWPTQSIFLY